MRAPEFWDRPTPALAALLLAPLAWVYGRIVAARVARPPDWRAPVPVVCVGNVVAGGAGKTPVVLDVGQRLAARGLDVHFLTRGYGGRTRGPLRADPDRHEAAEVGDEPLLLARARPTWVAADRAAGARAAVDAGAQILVMDDGFQNPSLHKDLSLLVIDGGYGIGNGRVIPAGPLREPLAAGLRRAGAVVMLGQDIAGLESKLAGRSVLRAEVVPEDGQRLAGRSVLAFAGIARPRKFFATLKSLGCRLAETRGFPDHHPYREGEVDALLARADELGAVAVTTAKDAMRLPPDHRPRIEVLEVGLRWHDESALDAILAPLLAGGR